MKTADFFFDLSSPYSYLAATQIPWLVAQSGGASVRWKPFVLGAVFKSAGNHMPAQIPAKAVFMLKDLGRWAKQYEVPFTFTSRFPVNALRAMRMIVAAEAHGKSEALAMAGFRAVWVDDQDVTTDETLRALATGAGLDADAMLAAIDTQPVKDRLRAYTDEALAAGAFGAPTFVVDGELFWGNDRLHHVVEALRA